MKHPSAQNWIERFNNSNLVRYLLLFALGWAIVQMLAYFETVIIVFSMAAILAFLLHYPVQRLQRFLPHNWSVIIVFLASLAVFIGLAATLGISILAQGQQLVEKAPEFLDYLTAWTTGIENWLRLRNLQLDLAAIEEQVREQALAGLGMSLSLFQQVITSVFNLIIIAVVAFFMLLDGARLWRLFLRLFPRNLREHLTEAVQRNFLGFFGGRLILSIFLAISDFIAFLIFGVPYPLILAVFVGLFDLIPGIGATIGIFLVALIILPQGVWLSLKVLVACILIEQIQENLLMPRIMKDSININPVVMFLALLVGGQIAGLFGVFLSIPITGTLISLFEVEEMKGESPVPVGSRVGE